MAKAYDVVCGMTVDTERAPSAEFQGKTYYFCCEGCKGAFQRSPEYQLETWTEEHPGLEPTP